jgi:hypothetical protein
MGLTKPRAAQIYDLDYKQAVRVITVTDIATLSGGAPNQVDGVSLSLNDRVLVAGQNTGSQNGLYYVQTVGTGSNGTWERTADGNQTGEIEAGMIVMVTEGLIYADTQWKLTTDDPIVIGVSALTFVINILSTVGGANTQVQFNDGGTLGATAQFTFDKISNALTVGGNITGGNLITSGNVTGGNLTTAGQASVTGNLTTANAVNFNLPNSSSTDVTISSGLATAFDTRIGTTADNQYSWRTNLYYTGAAWQKDDATRGAWRLNQVCLTGNANSVMQFTYAPIGTTNVNELMTLTGEGLLTVTGNITGNYILGNGSQLTGIVTDFTSLTSNIIPASNVTYSLGNATNQWANIYVGGNTIFLGGLQLKDDGSNTLGVYASDGTTPAELVATSELAQYVTQGAQANITSVGTLTVLDVTGNVSAGNVSGTLVTGTLTTASQPNITSVGTLTSLNVTGNVTGGNLSGTLVTGTLTTASQPNITSVGTLTSVSVTGNASIAGNLNMNSKNITSLANPVLAQDAATKTYVDNLVASGTHFHQPVRVESPTALTATYNNGTAGVGATLTNAGTQVALVIDGVTVSVNDRVLIYTQTDQTQNGVYVVTSVGSGATNWVLTRSDDADSYVVDSPTGLSEGSTFFVQQGATGAGETYTCNTTGVITFGTTNITFAQISTAQIYSAGTGLTLTGTTFSVNASQTQVTSVGTLTSLAVTGNTTSGNFVGTLNGSGANVTSISATNISSGTLAQARLANAAVTLGSTALTLGSTVTTVAGLSSVTSTTFVGALTGAATTAGTVTTAAQPNITSVGTLSSLAVTGNTSSGNFVGTLNGSGANVTAISATNISAGTLAQARLANSAVTLGSTALTLGATVTTVAGLSSVTSTTFVGALTGAATTAGTVTTAAQPNITSVGTMSVATITTLTTSAITKSGTNGVGNIGAVGSTFNTIFAKATSAQYADLAEMYVSDADYPPGTVVEFGGEHEITISSSSHSTAVAGIVSTNPSYLMNSSQSGEHVLPVALTGRVPCCVQGPVRKGDVLVSSNIPGVAQRIGMNWQPGCVLGKAMEKIESVEIQTIEVAVGRF